MKLHGKSGLAILLILCGSLILLSKLNFPFWHLFSYLIPFIVILLGYVGIRNGRTLIGSVILVVGLIMLVSKFATFFGFLVAVLLIIYGISLLRKNSRTV